MCREVRRQGYEIIIVTKCCQIRNNSVTSENETYDCLIDGKNNQLRATKVINQIQTKQLINEQHEGISNQ